MLKLHPMEAEDPTFTRPLIPYNCAAMGGCGPGTLRVPLKSCAIDLSMDMSKYDWAWFETARTRKKEEQRLALLAAATAVAIPA